MRRPGLVVWCALGACALAACGGEDASIDRTLATVELVRGELHVGDTADDADRVARTGRAAAEAVASGPGSLARLSMDSGPQLLLDAETALEVVDEETIRLASGRLYAEAREGEVLRLEHGQSTLRVSDAVLSARLQGDALRVYVVRGEIRACVAEACRHVGAGTELAVTGATVETTPVTLWHDWTGGLARPGPADARGAAGVGTLEARVPEEIGLARWPLVMRRLDVAVRIVGDLAVTEVEQVFFNPASETVEGTYRIRVPEEAVLQRFAVDRNGRLVDGYVREQAQARQAYEAQVYRGSTLDPALLEWVAPGRYQARIYPIQPGETRRIVIRYAEWLAPQHEGGPRLYRYPMGGGRDAPRIQEVSVVVDLEGAGVTHVRAGMGAAIEEGRVVLRRSDFAPRSDFWLELDGGGAQQRAWRAPHEPPPRAPDASTVVGEADERDYFYLPLRLPAELFEDARAEGMDLVIVADVSAATDRAQLELGRSVAEALTAHLGPQDRVAVVSSDLTIRSVDGTDAALGEASGARLDSLLDGLARAPAGGATDLGEAIGAAAALLDPARSGAVIYVGDGAPTVGELEADGMLERLARLPSPLRLYAVGLGGDANLDLLEVITRGGGLALRVEERSGAADAALRILAHAVRPVAQRVTVDLGTGIDNVYPRRPVDSVLGEVLPVVGRVREAPPTQVIVRGTIAGRDFEETIAITSQETEQSTDLRLRWAGERLRQLMLEGGQREEVVELGTRYGMITPFTSYYVPSAQELQQLGASALDWIDQPRLLARRRAARGGIGEAAATLALGPFALAGCMGGDAEPSSSSSPDMAEATGAVAPAGAYDEAATEEASEVAAAVQPMVVAEPMPSADPAPPPPPQAAPAEVPPMDQLARLGGYGAANGATAPPALRTVRAGGSVAAPTTPGVDGPMGGEVMEQRAVSRRAPRPSGQGQPGNTLIADGWNATPTSGTTAEESGEVNRERSRAQTFEDLLGDPNAARDREGDLDARDGRFWADPSGARRVTLTTVSEAHAVRRCSDAARLSLPDRRELWVERLGQQSSPHGWLSVFRGAVQGCEAPSWRDRRTILGAILAQAGSVESMISVYRLFTEASARGYLRGAILRRVRSPEDLRAVRAAFGLGNEPDWALVEQVLERAATPALRVRALRRLVMQFPESFDLRLRLLELLEVSGHAPEARRLAERLRLDPSADAGVRTAIGEMYLRMEMEDEARRVFSEIVEFAPLDELARRRLGDLYRAHGWYEDAYRQYQTLASIRPDDPTALLLLAQAAAGTGRIDEALRLEQRLMETAQPGEERGLARVAQLWTSLRLAKLRAEAREADDAERLQALDRRMRRSGVLVSADALRVSLAWSHPDAQLALYAAHPSAELARPREISPEHGIEVFGVPETEDGAYRLEVRRADPDSPTAMRAELVLVWHEGQRDEVVRVVPLDFSAGRASYAWTLRGSELVEGS